VSRVARCWSTWITSGCVLVALAGCGGKWQPTFASTGSGKDEYWTVRAEGKPKAVVVFLHGLGRDSGEQLEPWQAHLASEGYDVIYPRYEQPPPDPRARDNIVAATRGGLATLGRPHVPLVLLGHSRGGRLAVEAAAYLKPQLVLAFYPGQINPSFEPDTNFRLIPKRTSIWLFVGDRDTSVGGTGAIELATRMLRDHVPSSQINGATIHSQGFVADHMSVYDLSPAAKRGIWDRADRLIAKAVRGG
jgi:pimeloyl-ACP methyl ester carboxylesterase